MEMDFILGDYHIFIVERSDSEIQITINDIPEEKMDVFCFTDTELSELVGIFKTILLNK